MADMGNWQVSNHKKNRWLNARLQYLHCVNNADIAVLNYAICMKAPSVCINSLITPYVILSTHMNFTYEVMCGISAHNFKQHDNKEAMRIMQ